MNYEHLRALRILQRAAHRAGKRFVVGDVTGCLPREPILANR
jgi:hypothetical protein